MPLTMSSPTPSWAHPLLSIAPFAIFVATFHLTPVFMCCPNYPLPLYHTLPILFIIYCPYYLLPTSLTDEIEPGRALVPWASPSPRITQQVAQTEFYRIKGGTAVMEGV